MLTGDHGYEITVGFRGGTYGSFHQSLVLDFGQAHHLVRRLEVDVGEELHVQMERLRQAKKTNHWSAENVEIQPFTGFATIAGSADNDFTLKLLKKYKIPQDDNFSTASMTLKKDNYIQKMHDMLYLEEIKQLKIISRLVHFH